MRIKLTMMVAACAAMILPGYGSIIVNPTGQSNSGGSSDYTFDKVIDSSGLSAALNTGDAIPAVLPTHETPGWYNPFEDVAGRFTSFDAATTLTFDLGAAYELESLVLWNGAEAWGGVYYNNRGLDAFTMSFSTDGTTFGDTIAVDSTIIAEIPDFDAETFAIPNVTAQYVMFSDLVNGNGNGAHTAISEVRFTAVPEPATLGMVALFGGGILFIRRRLAI